VIPVTVTLTPGTTEPLVSVTVPSMFPVVRCPNAAVARQKTTNNVVKTLLILILMV
jgi:hypothetical protein